MRPCTVSNNSIRLQNCSAPSYYLQCTITPDATPGRFDFTYSVTLAADEQIVSGSYLTLYDFGAVAGSLPTATTGLMSTTNFTYSQALKGPIPTFLAPVDSATVLNVTA